VRIMVGTANVFDAASSFECGKVLLRALMNETTEAKSQRWTLPTISGLGKKAVADVGVDGEREQSRR
jgi:hypothetical protein